MSSASSSASSSGASKPATVVPATHTSTKAARREAKAAQKAQEVLDDLTSRLHAFAREDMPGYVFITDSPLPPSFKLANGNRREYTKNAAASRVLADWLSAVARSVDSSSPSENIHESSVSILTVALSPEGKLLTVEEAEDAVLGEAKTRGSTERGLASRVVPEKVDGPVRPTQASKKKKERSSGLEKPEKLAGGFTEITSTTLFAGVHTKYASPTETWLACSAVFEKLGELAFGDEEGIGEHAYELNPSRPETLLATGHVDEQYKRRADVQSVPSVAMDMAFGDHGAFVKRSRLKSDANDIVYVATRTTPTALRFRSFEDYYREAVEPLAIEKRSHTVDAWFRQLTLPFAGKPGEAATGYIPAGDAKDGNSLTAKEFSSRLKKDPEGALHFLDRKALARLAADLMLRNTPLGVWGKGDEKGDDERDDVVLFGSASGAFSALDNGSDGEEEDSIVPGSDEELGGGEDGDEEEGSRCAEGRPPKKHRS